jgi:hypothetical protein
MVVVEVCRISISRSHPREKHFGDIIEDPFPKTNQRRISSFFSDSRFKRCAEDGFRVGPKLVELRVEFRLAPIQFDSELPEKHAVSAPSVVGKFVESDFTAKIQRMGTSIMERCENGTEPLRALYEMKDSLRRSCHSRLGGAFLTFGGFRRLSSFALPSALGCAFLLEGFREAL